VEIFVAKKQVRKKLSSCKVNDIYIYVIPHLAHLNEWRT